MLQYFFEKELPSDVPFNGKSDRSLLFQGLKIASAEEKYQEHMGKYPVIMLNFKEAKQGSFDYCYGALYQMIASEYRRHSGVLDSERLTEQEKKTYRLLRDQEADYMMVVGSVQFLCQCLEKVYQEKVVVLIDEYDVPLENSHFRKFYNEMIDFIRGVLGATLKTNNSLKFAVITGCLRISKESIFTGLNNLEVVSIENKEYGEYFGFTEGEVREMLVHYDREQCTDLVRKWYNGYVFGKKQVYNPWSLVKYMNELRVDSESYPTAHWANTSSNSIVKELVYRADDVVKAEIEILLSGGSIEKPIHEDITYEDVYKSKDNLWNFLYFTGYLKKVDERRDSQDIRYGTLQIPNREIRYIYRNHIMEWMNECVYSADLTKLYEATVAGDVEVMEDEITRVLERTISCYDGTVPNQRETFYHGVMIGLYQGMKRKGIRIF